MSAPGTQLKMVGYTKLAALMADQPQYVIIPRFMTLRCSRLLHLTAELVQIATKLGVAVDQDRNSGDPERYLFETWHEKLLESKEKPQSAEQISLWDRLDAKLKEHGKALLVYRRLLELPGADKSDVSYLRSWLEDEKGGDGFLHAAEALIWDESKEKDLTSLSVQQDEEDDPLMQFIRKRAVPAYNYTLGQRHKKRLYIPDPFSGEQSEMPIYEYSDKAIARVVSTCSTMLASMIPALSTLVLYFIINPLARIGALIGLTFVFAVALNMVTKAKKVEIFAATAAFSAVLVVFVSGSGSNQCICSQG